MHDNVPNIEDLKNSIPYLITKASVYFKLTALQTFSNITKEITLDQFITLTLVYEDEDICQRDVCKLLLKDRSNVGRLMNILEKNEYLMRSAETKNNRLVKKMKVTQKGKDLVEKYFPPFMKEVKKTFSKFKEEDLKKLQELMVMVATVLSKETNIQI